MKPYFSEGDISIYHGDCADIVLDLPLADLVLTDPPYGLKGWNATGGQSLSEEEAAKISVWDEGRPSAETMHTAVNAGGTAIVWGGNYFNDILGPTRAPLIWDKGIRGMHFADGEMAWTNFNFGTLRIFNFARQRMKEPRVHPTQKPIALMKWCIEISKTTGSVIDPFMGSGSVLVAARSLGRAAVGVEVNEEYCEMAAHRISHLPVPTPTGQEALF